MLLVAKVINEKTGYLRLTSFNENSSGQIKEKIKDIKFTIQSPKGDKEVSVKDVLPNFGTDKKDKDTPATKKAQKEIHKYFVKKYEKQAEAEKAERIRIEEDRRKRL